MDSPGFHDLVEQARAGDRKAMDQVLEMLRPHLKPLARLYANPLRPAESTADLLQESCLRAWQKLDKFESGHNDEETFAMFRGWIGQIVRRLGMNARRDRDRQKRSPPEKILPLDAKPAGGITTGVGLEALAPDATPSAYARGNELSQRIEEVLDGLPDKTDTAIARLYFFEELNLSQISKRLGLGYDHVRDHYHAVVRRLERDLKQWI
ncbi:MAG: RNA polymerase sigma factor [Planctomycetota bacterium]|nr:RNA polymerase sigma factor [Planctomycetota bacterium]